MDEKKITFKMIKCLTVSVIFPMVIYKLNFSSNSSNDNVINTFLQNGE